MNAITNALMDLRYSVDVSILELAFNKKEYGLSYVSLDEKITAAVIRPKVMKDCNIISGESIRVRLQDCKIEYVNNVDTIVTVPSYLTNGRAIISANNLIETVMSQNLQTTTLYPAMSGQSDLMEQYGKMGNSLANMPGTVTSRLTLIGNNKIYISEPLFLMGYGLLDLTIENGANYENLPRRAYLLFASLVTLAVKAFIFSRVRLNLDKGYIYQGHELGYVNDVIDGYSTAYDDYIEFLTKRWKPVTIMADSDYFTSLIRARLGNNL